MAQWLSIYLWLRAWSWGPGIESRTGLPAGEEELSLCLSWINKILKIKNNMLIYPNLMLKSTCYTILSIWTFITMKLIPVVKKWDAYCVTGDLKRAEGNYLRWWYCFNILTWYGLPKCRQFSETSEYIKVLCVSLNKFYIKRKTTTKLSLSLTKFSLMTWILSLGKGKMIPISIER